MSFAWRWRTQYPSLALCVLFWGLLAIELSHVSVANAALYARSHSPSTVSSGCSASGCGISELSSSPPAWDDVEECVSARLNGLPLFARVAFTAFGEGLAQFANAYRNSRQIDFNESMREKLVKAQNALAQAQGVYRRALLDEAPPAEQERLRQALLEAAHKEMPLLEEVKALPSKARWLLPTGVGVLIALLLVAGDLAINCKISLFSLVSDPDGSVQANGDAKTPALSSALAAFDDEDSNEGFLLLSGDFPEEQSAGDDLSGFD